jgi:hypothetical protein
MDTGVTQHFIVVNIEVTPRSRGGVSYRVNAQAMRYDESTGDYELQETLPGMYLVTATEVGPSALGGFSPVGFDSPEGRIRAAETNRAAAAAREGIAYAILNVADADVDNVALNIAGGGAIAGRIHTDVPAASVTQDLLKLSVLLKTTWGGIPVTIQNAFPPIGAPGANGKFRFYGMGAGVAADGAFRFPSAQPGEYRVVVEGLDPGFYVKEAHFGAEDALNRSVAFTLAESKTLDVVLAWGAPEIRGIVTGGRLEPFPGAHVLLVPAERSDRGDLYRPVTTGRDGGFVIANVPPGDYLVFAWDGPEAYSYLDPMLQQRDADKAVRLPVEESASQTLELRAIPATQE